MNTLIREQAEKLGFQITDWDIDQIKEIHFWSLHRNGQAHLPGIKAAVKTYFAD